MDGASVLEIAVGVVLGGIVSLAVSAYYARQGSEELRTEANKLRQETEDVRHYINALITYLEAAGAISVVRDESGRPVETHIILLSGTARGTSRAAGTLTVTYEEPSEDDPDHEDLP